MANAASNSILPDWLRIVLIGRKPKWTLVRVAVLVVASYVVFGFFLLVIRIDGLSMLPTYRHGRVNVVNRLAYLWHEPHRGDVISIRLSGSEYTCGEFFHDLTRFRLDFSRVRRPSVMYMKRVVGQPGETIAFEDGCLVINGRVIQEPYVKYPCRWQMPPRKLGPDEYFVVGDNRQMPLADHTHGVPARNRIVGRVML